MRIILLHPTVRTEVFKQNHEMWMKRRARLSGVPDTSWVPVVTYVGVDTIEMANELEDYNVIVTHSKRQGVCEPLQKMIDKVKSNINDDDIIVVKSDDFLPPEGWDQYLVDKLQGEHGVLMVRDGYQRPDSSNMQFPCVTIPILTGGSLVDLNYKIYPDAYFHMYSDCELYMNAKELGILIDDRKNDDTTFEHLHWAAGKRKADDADRMYHEFMKQDEIMFYNRKNMTVDERLKD